MKSLTTQPPDETILSITIRRRSATATPPSIFFSSREVRNAGFGRLIATTARFMVPGSGVAGADLNAGWPGLTTRGRVSPFETTGEACAAFETAATCAVVISGGASVAGTAELDGREGNCGPESPWRSATERFCGNDSVALRWANSAANLFCRTRA